MFRAVTPKQPLPIDPHLPGILASLEATPNLVIQASPGSGKTTRVPPFLLASRFSAPGKEIVVLVPRRLAAKMAALRVAEEMGEEIGGTVGYQFRFENVCGPRTRLKFLTEGLLLRRLIDDPELKRAACVVLDEFHERHVHSDVALSYLRWLQKEKRPDLRIVVMSATLETAPVRKFLGDCPLKQIEAAQYPVEIRHLDFDAAVATAERVTRAVATLPKNPGDTLVFLPGMADILRAADNLERNFPGRFAVLPLHGELPKERQAAVFEKAAKPKIILATNVAETSLTIDGVTVVIDSGLHRRASYSWWSGVPSLQTRPVAKASAIQRAGRAGRTAPGTCLRLYAKADFDGRADFEVPEIRRADLAQILLEIKAWGTADAGDFPWFETPSRESLAAATELLAHLGAVPEKNLSAPLTAAGRDMARLPLHPRFSRFLIEAKRRGVLPRAVFLCALISEGALENTDLFAHFLKPPRGDGLFRQERILLAAFGEKRSERTPPSEAEEEILSACLLRGFPDRVARKRPALATRKDGKSPEAELVFCFGGSGSVPAAEIDARRDTFLVLDVQERRGSAFSRPKVHVKTLCPVRPEWLLDLDSPLLVETEETAWNAAQKRVMKISQLRYGQITLTESNAPAEPGPETAGALLKGALSLDGERLGKLVLADFLEALKRVTDPEPVAACLSRLKLAEEAGLVPAGTVPKEPGLTAAWLLQTFRGALSESDLDGAALSETILGALPPETRALVARELPENLALPGGRRVKIRYEWDKSPWIASRLQDFFGMKESPKLARGRVPLTLHLLAPNQRALQVTSDLGSFWTKIYPELRNQLARRYPRHAWPEKPV